MIEWIEDHIGKCRAGKLRSAAARTPKRSRICRTSAHRRTLFRDLLAGAVPRGTHVVFDLVAAEDVRASAPSAEALVLLNDMISAAGARLVVLSRFEPPRDALCAVSCTYIPVSACGNCV